MTRKHSDDELQGMDPREAFRLGKMEAYQEQIDELRKEVDILEIEKKQSELDLEVLKKRLGLG